MSANLLNEADKQHWLDSTELIKVDVKELQLGMYVSKLDRPWLETNFWFQGFELRTQEEIEAVQNQCEYVFVEVKKSTAIPQRPASVRPLSQPRNTWQDKERLSFQNQVNRAEILFRHTSEVVNTFMEEAKYGRPINTVLAKKTVGKCVDAIFELPNTLLLMTQLKSKDKYTAQHSMNVCLFSIALGRQLDLNKNELNNLGLCGMMHDMGKMLIPDQILNKPERLTPYEMEVMKSHATEGWRLLLNTTGMYKEAVDVAHMHHERLDGIGYPRGLQAGQITAYSQLVAIVDIYDAMTSNRVYQTGMAHLDAIGILTDSARQGHLNLSYTRKFIECLGVYPAGCLVEMTSGETALVLDFNPKAKLKPKVLILKDAGKNRCHEYIVDLAMLSADNDQHHYTIKRIIPPHENDIDLGKYYHTGMIGGLDFL